MMKNKIKSLNERQPLRNNQRERLSEFYNSMSSDSKVLLVVGRGTASLTYLYTEDITSQYTHIIMLGKLGYWNIASHRLAQPHHILALPHHLSEPYIDPAKHDADKGILPHQPESAYVHSSDYQIKLQGLEEQVMIKLKRSGTHVYIEQELLLTKITRGDNQQFFFELEGNSEQYLANKIIVANGAGPARRLPTELQESLVSHLSPAVGEQVLNDRILNYNDILSPVAEKCKGKEVIIYGGGATAAWAMEVADLIARPLAWVAKSGFGESQGAGPRVKDIISKTQDVQVIGSVFFIAMIELPDTSDQKLMVKVGNKEDINNQKTYIVDYFINCIGQEPYELGGLPHIMSPQLKAEIVPILDINDTNGTGTACMLGWGTEQGDFLMIGAAQGTYYNREQPIDRPPAISDLTPRSAQVQITIGGVIATISALTNYMPLVQNPEDFKMSLLSMNVHMMNATQLAVYFSGCYPKAPAAVINTAVSCLMEERAKTEFGLDEPALMAFTEQYFETLSISGEADQLFANGLMPSQKNTNALVKVPLANNPASFFKRDFSNLSPDDERFNQTMAVLANSEQDDLALSPLKLAKIERPTTPDDLYISDPLTFI